MTNNTATSTLVLNRPLKFTHLGVRFTVPGDDQNHLVDMAAEVAVLTRNVKVQGDSTSSQYQFGATIKVTSPAGGPKGGIILEQAEFTQMGKTFLLGEYAIHWHLLVRRGEGKACQAHPLSPFFIVPSS